MLCERKRRKRDEVERKRIKMEETESSSCGKCKSIIGRTNEKMERERERNRHTEIYTERVILTDKFI